MTVAEHIADELFNKGVRYIFGIPGGPSIPYIEALRKRGVEFILTANESAAGIMADVTARLTGTPGICHSTFGPGATNLASGIGEALLDRSPVIALTSEIADNMIFRTTQMNIDHQQLFRPVTKATFRLTPQNIREVLQKAFQEAEEEYPGPVHIGLPSDISGFETSDEVLQYSDKNIPEHKNDVNAVLNLLGNARQPLIAIGLTYARLVKKGKLEDFLDRCPFPVVLTPMAKGVLDENHPCYAGVLFHALSSYISDIVNNSDLVIGLGYDQVEYNYESWMPDIPLLHFNTKDTDLPKFDEVVQFTGQPDDWFSILGRIDTSRFVFNRSSVELVRDKTLSVLDGLTDHFGPVTVLKVLQEELPEDVIVTADVGSHLHLAGQMWLTGGRKNLIMTNGWSGMGFGLPASIAAKIAKPDSPVVCLTGDGGFLMMAGEMITARRYKLPVIVVVFSDGELNLIKLKQSWQNSEIYGTELYSDDLFGAGMFLGTRVITADSETKMRKAVIVALSLNEPVIINAKISPEDYNHLIVKKQN